MQLTIDIPQEHAGTVLTFLAGLTAKTIDAAPVAKIKSNNYKPPMAPQVGMEFFMRNGKVAHIESRKVDGSYKGTIDIDGEFCDYHWNGDGTSLTDFHDFDLVELTPF